MDYDFVCQNNMQLGAVENLYDYEQSLIGFGSYGKVYKAISKTDGANTVYALKEILYGLSAQALREIGLLRELKHDNVVKLFHVYRKDFNMLLLLEYAEYDLHSLLKYHRETVTDVHALPSVTSKSILQQLLNGIFYLHNNWVMHRDLKPANILIMGDGQQRGRLKIADMGFSRLFVSPLKSFAEIDAVVVSLWYRAPELLLGAQHYTVAIDMWSIGCIFAELLTLRPIFFTNKFDTTSGLAYNEDVLNRILSVIGFPRAMGWAALRDCMHYELFRSQFPTASFASCSLSKYMLDICKLTTDTKAYGLLQKLLTIPSKKRISADDALKHEYFKEEPLPKDNVFGHDAIIYPAKKILKSNNEPNAIKLDDSESDNINMTNGSNDSLNVVVKI